jgi:hypothetical protein
MRTHVIQTIEDLRSTAAELTRMAQTLEVVFAEAPTATVPTPELAPVPTPAAAVEPPARRRRVSSREPEEKPLRNYMPKARGGMMHAVRCAVAELQEPFSQHDVRSWLEQKVPKVLATAGRSTISTALFSLKSHNLIRDVDKKPGPRGPVSAYKRAPGFTAEPGPAMSEKERRYRELRAEVKTGEQQEAA